MYIDVYLCVYWRTFPLVKPQIWWKGQSLWWPLSHCHKIHSSTSCLCEGFLWHVGSPSPVTQKHCERDVVLQDPCFMWTDIHSKIQVKVFYVFKWIFSNKWIYYKWHLVNSPVMNRAPVRGMFLVSGWDSWERLQNSPWPR